MKKNLAGVIALVATVLLAGLALPGCEEPTSSAVKPGSADTAIKGARRALPADFGTRKAVAYSGYRKATNNDADAPSIADIDQDLGLMNAKGFTLLRLFGSGDIFGKKVVERISALKLDMKVQLGIWIVGSKALTDADNQVEIAKGVALAKAYPTIVAAVSVGNEKMVNWNTWGPCPIADMAGYIKQVRDQVTQPVTTDENWAVWANDGAAYSAAKSIVAAVDYVAVHTYPIADTPWTKPDGSYLWDWHQTGVAANLRAAAMMDAGLGKAKADYEAVVANLAAQGFASIPVIIGETGWKSVSADWTDRAHPVNQAMYHDRLDAWKAQAGGPVQIISFEAFDEPWKAGDDNWGFWKVDRTEKYVLSRTGSTSADAVYYVPLTPNPPITTNTYLVLADTLANDATTTVPVKTVGWNAWDGNTASVATMTGTAGAGQEGTNYAEITPIPSVNKWGWGVFLDNTNPDDLSAFTNGHLKFLMKTSYPGTLEIGFFTKSNGGNADVYIKVPVGSYGRTASGNWDSISIPIADLIPKAAPAFGQPAGAKINLPIVANPLVIADRYANTGTTGSPVNKIDVDNVLWTKD